MTGGEEAGVPGGVRAPGPRRVVMVAVQLGHDSVLLPEVIDLAAEQRHVDGGDRQPVGPAEAEETGLAAVASAGDGQGRLTGERSQGAGAALRAGAFARRQDLGPLREPESLRFVEGADQLPLTEDAGEVEERAGGRGDPEGAEPASLDPGQRTGPVDDDPVTGRLRPCATVTCTGPGIGSSIPWCSPASRWLRNEGAVEISAAIQRARPFDGGTPTA